MIQEYTSEKMIALKKDNPVDPKENSFMEI